MVFTVGVFALLCCWFAGEYIFCTGINQQLGLWMSVGALFPLLMYSALIFVDSSIKNRSLNVGLLSVPAAFIQLIGYGLGFLKSWWKRCVLKQDEFTAFEKNFYQ